MGVAGIYLHTDTFLTNKGIMRTGAKNSIILGCNLPWKAHILSSGLFPRRTFKGVSL